MCKNTFLKHGLVHVYYMYICICKHLFMYMHIIICRFMHIMPTLLKTYSNNQPNPVLCQAIEFVCRQFYILHRKPFILQASHHKVLAKEVKFKLFGPYAILFLRNSSVYDLIWIRKKYFGSIYSVHILNFVCQILLHLTFLMIILYRCLAV